MSSCMISVHGTVIKKSRTQDHMRSFIAVFRLITLNGSTNKSHVGA